MPACVRAFFLSKNNGFPLIRSILDNKYPWPHIGDETLESKS